MQVEGLKIVTTQLLQAALPARVADGTSAAIADGRWPVDAALALHQQVGHHAMAHTYSHVLQCFTYAQWCRSSWSLACLPVISEAGVPA